MLFCISCDKRILTPAHTRLQTTVKEKSYGSTSVAISIALFWHHSLGTSKEKGNPLKTTVDTGISRVSPTQQQSQLLLAFGKLCLFIRISITAGKEESFQFFNSTLHLLSLLGLGCLEGLNRGGELLAEVMAKTS